MNKLRKGMPLILILIFLFSFAACEMGGYRSIPPEKAREMIESGKGDLLLLDVRTPDEYREGHLKNAVLIPIQELPERIGEIAGYKEKEVIVYCAVGGRSSKASAMLKEKGFQKVYNMNGGIRAWGGAGYEVVR